LEPQIVVDPLRIVPVKLAGKDIGETIFFLGGDERIEDDFAFLALARIERHDLQA